MCRTNCIPRNKQGSVIIMTAFAAIFLLGMTALVTDVGYLYFNQARLQTAVNAGWKAGYDKLMQLTPDRSLPSEENQVKIRDHVLEVMKNNGYSDAELVNVFVEFGPNYRIKVSSKQKVGLFFARVMDFSAADVAAARANQGESSGMGIVPLAIPHGVTKDLSRNVYGCELFTGDGGFASGTEYILKLGSGGGNIKVPPDITDPRMIFVPMDSGSQTETGFTRAYGAVFWCLRYDNSDSGYVPVMWLMGLRGGSFMLPYDAAVTGILSSYGVNYEIISGADNIQWYYDQSNPNIVELFNRPRIAVHTNSSSLTDIESLFIDSRIPYGNYSLPPSIDKDGWKRANYNSNKNVKKNDLNILAGELDSYHLVFTANEDFTGFSKGCSFYADTCETFLINNRLGDTKNAGFRAKVKESMCAHCQQYYNTGANIDFTNAAHLNNYLADINVRNNVWSNAYEVAISGCHNRNRRCAEKRTATGLWWRDLSAVTICGTTENPQCREFKPLLTQAAGAGFISDEGSIPKPQTPLDFSGNSSGIDPSADGWFNRANSVQKFKWSVADKLRLHVEAGGYLFAQSLSAESLDLAISQKAIYDGKSLEEANMLTLAFDEIVNHMFPARTSLMRYSSVNSLTSSINQPFSLLNNIDPRSQNHMVPDTGFGLTSAFSLKNLKPENLSLGNSSEMSDYSKYLKGQKVYGEFAYLGGENLTQTAAKRLVLNNLLQGSMVEKTVTGGNFLPLAGKQKSNYGPVDPDNYTGGGANDYRDRFMNGFNAPLEINDRLIAESGNMRGPTDQAVDFRINGNLQIPPSRRVIVPITDIPPEVLANNPHNANAKTLYDLQGNDQPDGAYKPSDYDFKSAVRIIGFAEFEILDPSEYTRDGESLSSGDSGDLGPYQPGQVRGKFIRYIVKPGDAPLL